MPLKPCLECGEPSTGTRCRAHRLAEQLSRKGSFRERGYSTAWSTLSRRARRIQPWCSDCGATADLQLDHTERTWARVEAGKVLRLADTGGVVCGPCNRARGAARGRLSLGEAPALDATVLPPKPQGPLHTPGGHR